MKDKFKEKYLLESSRHRLLLHNLCEGSMSVQDYMTIFDDLTLCCKVQEDCHQDVSRFHSGLRFDIHRVMLIHSQNVISLA